MIINDDKLKKCRYFGLLMYVVYCKLISKPKYTLYIDYEYNITGFGYVDIDIELEDGNIFSYKYEFGCCGECDNWERNKLTFIQIIEQILKDCKVTDRKTYIVSRTLSKLETL